MDAGELVFSKAAMKRILNILWSAAIILSGLLAVVCWSLAANAQVPPLPVAPATVTSYHAATITKGASQLIKRTVAITPVAPLTVTVTLTPSGQLLTSSDLFTWTPVGEPTNQFTLTATNSVFARGQAMFQVAWDASPNATGYILFEYFQPSPQSEPYTNWDVGNVTNAWIPALVDGTNGIRAEAYMDGELDESGNPIRCYSPMTDSVFAVPVKPTLAIQQNK